MLKPTLALFAISLAVAAPAAPAFAGDGKDLLKYAPEASQMVLVLDLADARDSALIQKGFQKLLDTAPDAKTKLAELGLDPMKDVDTVMLAGGGATDFSAGGVKNIVIIVEGRLPKDKLATAPNATKSMHQGVAIYTNNDTDAAFIGDRLFFAKKGSMKTTIDLALGKGRSKGKSVAASKKAKALRDAIAATDTTADLWATVLVPAKTRKSMQSGGFAPQTVSAGFNFTTDLGIAMKIGTGTADAAIKAVASIQAMLPQALQGFNQIGLTKAAKSLTVTQADAFVNVALTMTEAELMSLVNVVQAMGGMGGGAP